jgi:hypothetical protein
VPTACQYERVSRETKPTVIEPRGELHLMFLARDEGFCGRLEQSLKQHLVAGALLEDTRRGDFFPILVRLLATEDGAPLRWATYGPGKHGWEVIDQEALLNDLHSELGCVVASENGILGGAEDDTETEAEAAALERAFAIDALSWYQPGGVEIVAVLATQAGETVVAAPAGSGWVGQATISPNLVFESGAWAAKGGLFLARSGERSGAGFYSKDEPVLSHWWDEKWLTIDPSQPWEMDEDGWPVRDYFAFLLPDVETEPWTSNFRLDGADAEELRVILRAASSDEETFDRLVRATGVPMLLAEAATGRAVLSDADGVRSITPDTKWNSLKQAIREDAKRDVDYPAWASPLAKWDKLRERKSPVYLAVYIISAVVLGGNVLYKLIADVDDALLWWKVAALVLIVGDLLRPRRKPVEDADSTRVADLR